MPYQPVPELKVHRDQDRVMWFVANQRVDPSPWTAVEIQWPNGNILHHKLTPIGNGDVLVTIKFHGLKVNISLAGNPDLRSYINGIKYRQEKPDGRN